MGIFGVMIKMVQLLFLSSARFLLPLLMILVTFRLLNRNWAKKQQREAEDHRRKTHSPHFRGEVKTVDYREVEEDREMAVPEPPVPFGYKTGWAAIRCGDPRQVMQALGLREAGEASWSAGLVRAGERGQVFVSPRLDGFVLVIGLLDTLDGTGELPRWTAAFSEVQFFATHRVSEFHRWGRCQAGRLTRDYCWCGERGEVLRDVGEPTAEETALGFGRFPRMGRETDCEDLPNEENVLDIAAAWGIDPRFRWNEYPPSLGWLCES